MYNFLLKTFVKNYENVNDPKVRRDYGMFSGVIGIICNVILFGLKLAVECL